MKEIVSESVDDSVREQIRGVRARERVSEIKRVFERGRVREREC